MKYLIFFMLLVHYSAQDQIQATGQTESLQSVTIYPRVNGVIEKIYFEIGDTFRKGDVLAEIDNNEYILEVKKARLNVEIAKQRLELSEQGARLEEQKKNEAALKSAKEVFDKNRLQFKRLQNLLQDGGVSQFEYDQSEKELEVARANLEQAEKTLEISVKGVRPEEKQIARYSLDLALKELDQAVLKLSYTKIRAPFDGGIGMKMAEVGDTMSSGKQGSGTPVCVYSNSYVQKAVLNIATTELPFIRIGSSVRLEFDHLSNQEIYGKLHKVYPYIDPNSRMAKIEVYINNNPPRILSGMFVKATVPRATKAAKSSLDLNRVEDLEGSLK